MNINKKAALILCLSTSYFLKADINSLTNIDGEQNKDLVFWDCKRADVIFPFTKYPLSFSDKYLVNSYQTLFSSVIREEDQQYISALKQIANENLPEAESILTNLIENYPEHAFAYIQLGYIHVWLTQYDLAAQYFLQVVKNCGCNRDALDGLYLVAKEFLHSQGNEEKAQKLFEVLCSCVPDSFDFQFGLAVSLSRQGEWEQAEKIFNECLESSPDNPEVLVQLGNIYFWQKNYDKALEFYRRCEANDDCQQGVAKIALVKKDYQLAKKLYSSIKEKNPSNIPALKNLARINSLNLDFDQAKVDYQQLLSVSPNDDNTLQELYEVRLRTDPALNYNISFVEAKENDPNIGKPVVKDYYFDNDLIAFLPINNRWRLDFKTFFAFQNEKNILPTNYGWNYRADISGAGIFSHFLFKKYWKWDLFTNVKTAWNVGSNYYPFQNTTRFEPGSNISFITDDHYLLLGFDVDSYVIKNFAKGVSQLLTLRYLNAIYRYTMPFRFKPEIEGLFQETYIIAQPRNKRDVESVTVRTLIPYAEEYLKIFYTFEHGHFHKLNVNYYSFYQQWRNTVGISLFHSWLPYGTSFDITYWYRAQTTKDLYQPIGDFIYITPMQYLNCNQVQATITYRRNDFFKMFLSGGYYRDTLPYRAWNVSGNFYWVF